jgi:hypothetical protein
LGAWWRVPSLFSVGLGGNAEAAFRELRARRERREVAKSKPREKGKEVKLATSATRYLLLAARQDKTRQEATRQGSKREQKKQSTGISVIAAKTRE